MQSVVSISIGAILGALMRWKLGEHFNHLFPTLPLGTLVANLAGAFLMGAMIFLSIEHSFFSYNARLGFATGFLGSLTTFSTFSGEAFALLSKQEFLWLAALILLHVAGSILMVIVGYTLSKLIFQGA
jgi:CrcB protein